MLAYDRKLKIFKLPPTPKLIYKVSASIALTFIPLMYGTPNTSEVTSSFVDNQKFVLTIRNLC